MNTSLEYQLPIASLSLNPAIDLSYQIVDLKHEQKTRAISTRYDPGGTGINVGRALEKLNANSLTCCIIAGKMGEFLNSMLKREISNSYTLQISGETRINTTLLQQFPRHQYEINATGPKLNPSELDKISTQFLKYCKQGFGILTGSLPPGINDNTYRNINIELQKQGGHAIIDAPVAVMKKALHSNPFLIKPNLSELQILRNKTLSSIEDIAAEARLIIKQGTRHVCVSLGSGGAILAGPENSYYCNSPNITVSSTVGAGDSMVAGLAYAFAQAKSPQQALIFAVACGAGTAKQPGTQLFNTSELSTLEKSIRLKTLDI